MLFNHLRAHGCHHLLTCETLIYFSFLDFGIYVATSCEVFFAQYYIYAILAFSVCCAIGLTLFTLFSFVLILKRISQVS